MISSKNLFHKIYYFNKKQYKIVFIGKLQSICDTKEKSSIVTDLNIIKSLKAFIVTPMFFHY